MTKIKTKVISYTRSGFLPHITPQLNTLMNNASSQTSLIALEHILPTMPIDSKFTIKQTNKNLSKEKLFVTACDITDEPRLSTAKSIHMVLSNKQHAKMSAAEYVKNCVDYDVDVCIAANDYDSKSVEFADVRRNLAFLESQIDTLGKLKSTMKLYAVVTGFESEKANVLLEKCDGYVVKVIDKLSLRDQLEILSTIKKNSERPVFVIGIRSFQDLVFAIKSCVDYIDDSWAYECTRNYTCISLSSTGCELTGIENSDWRDSPEKLDDRCECMTCTRHTRAYLHHLVFKREISALTLLQVHNMHQIRKFVVEYTDV